jgi:hypothetical protein
VLEVGGELGSGHDRVVHRRLEDDDAPLAARLRRIHGDVGVAEEVACGVDARTTGCDPDARPDVDLAALDLEQRAHGGREPVGHAHRGLHVRGVAEEHSELVAAEPSGHVGRPQHRMQPVTHGDEERVAGGMTKAVVDELEVVEVDEQDDRDVAGRVACLEP